MVTVPETTVPGGTPTATVTTPITDPVPPDNLFACDDTDSGTQSLGDFILFTNELQGRSQP